MHFDTLCNWLETEGELHTLSELHQQMISIAGTTDVYSEKWIKVKLIEKYQDNINFNEVNGRCNVVCLSSVSKYLINDMWYKNLSEDDEEESKRIISTAAKILISEMRSSTFEREKYPTNECISDLDNNLQRLPPDLLWKL